MARAAKSPSNLLTDTGQFSYPATRPPVGRAECGSGALSRKVAKMLLASRFAAAATVWLVFGTMESPAKAASDSCGDAAGFTVLPSPVAPWRGAPLRVMVVTEKPLQGAPLLIAPEGGAGAQ